MLGAEARLVGGLCATGRRPFAVGPPSPSKLTRRVCRRRKETRGQRGFVSDYVTYASPIHCKPSIGVDQRVRPCHGVETIRFCGSFYESTQLG